MKHILIACLVILSSNSAYSMLRAPDGGLNAGLQVGFDAPSQKQQYQQKMRKLIKKRARAEKRTLTAIKIARKAIQQRNQAEKEQAYSKILAEAVGQGYQDALHQKQLMVDQAEADVSRLEKEKQEILAAAESISAQGTRNIQLIDALNSALTNSLQHSGKIIEQLGKKEAEIKQLKAQIAELQVPESIAHMYS